ncbi:MAG: hypothetical protein ABI666_04045 [Ferruginibacter sp.]
MKNNLSNNRTERVMGSLDSLQKATAPDFFYTRLKGKMQMEMEPAKKPFFLLRPAFITAVLSIFLIINVFSLFEIGKVPKQNTATQPNNQATIESFATAYNMNTGSVYE